MLATGAVTLLSAPEKIGKTTLLSLLLDRLRAGGELLGRTVWPGKTILCSEENKQLWALRQPPLDFGPDLIFHQPPGPFPMRGRWKRFVNDVFELCFPDGAYDLVVIDTAVSFLPLADRNKRTLRWAISTLGDLASLPVAVLVLNQSRNVHRPLAAAADIVIDMAIPRGQGMTRRRTFTGVGRYPETLQTATAELNPEGTDYVLLPDSPAPHPPLLSALQTLLTASPAPLTCRELLDRWPSPAPGLTLAHAGARHRTRPLHRSRQRHEDGAVSVYGGAGGGRRGGGGWTGPNSWLGMTSSTHLSSQTHRFFPWQSRICRIMMKL